CPRSRAPSNSPTPPGERRSAPTAPAPPAAGRAVSPGRRAPPSAAAAAAATSGSAPGRRRNSPPTPATPSAPSAASATETPRTARFQENGVACHRAAGSGVPLRLDPTMLRAVYCYGPVGVTDEAMQVLWAHEIEVTWLTAGGTKCKGRLVRS